MPEPKAFRPGLADYWPVALLAVVYAWSLSYGYLWDDYYAVKFTYAEAARNSLIHVRPISYFSFPLIYSISPHPFGQHLFNYAFLLGCVAAACRVCRRYDIAWGGLVTAAAFLHPSFLYPTTWVSQRADLIMIVFALLAILYVERRRGFAYLVLSDLGKVPFVFHNVWYAVHKWRNSKSISDRTLALAAVLLLIPLLGASVVFYDGYKDNVPHGLFLFDGQGLFGFVVWAVARAAKIAESLVLIFVPLPALYGAMPLWAVVSLLVAALAAWITLAAAALQGWRDGRGWPRFLAVALLSTIPFAINSDPRVWPPAIPFLFLGIVSFVRPTSAAAGALGILALVYGLGTAFNYGLSDTGVYVPSAIVDYTLCGPHEMAFPMERWRCDRSKVVESIVDWLNQL